MVQAFHTSADGIKNGGYDTHSTHTDMRKPTTFTWQQKDNTRKSFDRGSGQTHLQVHA